MSERPGERPSERRSNLRTSVVWSGLADVLEAETRQVLDIGGGTGGSAVELARRGHHVTVVDPSPDALASLERRAAEAGVSVTAHQGDLSSLLEVADPGSADLVLCHGVLEVVEDPAAALATITRVLRPGGTLSLLVAQRHAAVIARAMAGHFQQALATLDGTDPVGRTGRRFTAEELTDLCESAGLGVQAVHAVRVFTDLVPGSLLDLEPGAHQALLELEHTVAQRPEYLPLATQLHVLART